MATVKFGPLVQSARGGLGSVVFARQGGAGIVRQRPMKVNQESVRQLQVRTQYARAVELWSGLAQADRDAWFRCAQVYKATSPEGESRPMSAWLVFATVALRMLDTPYGDATFWLTANPVFGNLENGTVRLDVWPGGPANVVHSRGTVYDDSFTATVILYSVSVQRVFRTLPGWPGQSWSRVWHDISIGYSNNVSEGFAALGTWPAIGERIRWRVVSHYPAWPGRTLTQGYSVVPNVGPELIGNGDMELPIPATGAPPTGWTVTGAGVLSRVVTQPWGDDASARWTRAAGGGVSYLYAAIGTGSVAAGTYTLRFAARCVAGVAWADILATEVGVGSVVITSACPPADGVWREYSYSFVVPSLWAAGRLNFHMTGAAAVDVEVDNVSIRRDL